MNKNFRDADLELAFANLTDLERATVICAANIATREKVGIEALANYCVEFIEWIEKTDQEHRAECTDPTCDAIVCLRARLRSIFTDEEREARRKRSIQSKALDQLRTALAVKEIEIEELKAAARFGNRGVNSR